MNVVMQGSAAALIIAISITYPISLQAQVSSAPNPQAADATSQVASVTSAPAAQSGEDHRSSGNFSTFGGQHAKNFLWTVTQDGAENHAIRFNVKNDRRFKGDPVIYSQIGNNSRTGIIRERSLYIADPDGAAGKSFLVTVHAVAE